MPLSEPSGLAVTTRIPLFLDDLFAGDSLAQTALHVVQAARPQHIDVYASTAEPARR
jgi:hypothetical protein